MSEQKVSFMAALDAWSDKSIIEPLADAYLNGPEETRRSMRAKPFALRCWKAIAMAKPLARANPISAK